MPAKTTNNAYGTLNAGINNSVTTINLSSGQGAKFPSLSAGEFFYGTLIAVDNTTEIVKVTARSSDALTVTRAQDNTSASAFSTGDRFELRPTAALFNEFVQKTGDTIDGNLTLTGVVRFEGSTANDFETTLTVTDPTADRTITFPDATGQVVLSSGAIDTDASAEIGRAHIGNMGHVDWAGFSHIDSNGTGSYALLQNSTGWTIVNAPTGQIVDFRNNNSGVAHVSSGGLYMYAGKNFYFEGSTDNDYEITLTVTDPTADRTITFPDATGTVITTGNSDTPTTTTSSSDADFVLVDDGGTMKKITPANLGIGAGALANQTWGASLDSDSANESKLFFKNDHANIVIGAGSSVAEPSASLDETGSATNNVFIGNSAGTAATTAVSNVFIGTRAGEDITTGDENVFIGYEAARNTNAALTRTVAVGWQAGYGMPNSGNQNITTVGWQAGWRVRENTVCVGTLAGANLYNTNGGSWQGTHVGSMAGYNYYNYYASYNCNIGYAAGDFNRNGDYTTTLGWDADTLSTDTDYAISIGASARVSAYGVSIGYQTQYSGNTGSQYMVSIGYQAAYDMDGGDHSIYIGYQAGYGGGTADNNIGVGRTALYNVTSGGNNIGVGYNALNALTEGDHNVMIGYQAGDTITTGSYNVCVGNVSDAITATKEKGVAVGYHADCVTQGTAVGYAAQSSAHTSAFGATSIGYNAGNDVRNNYNTFVGWEAGKGSSGDENVGIGKSAIDAMSSSSDYNTAVGSDCMNVASGVSGSSNSALGYSAGTRLDSGNDNTAVGANAMGGATDLTGSNNTCIGHDAIPSAASVSNEITLGDSNVATLRCQVTSITALSDQRDKTAIEDLDLGLKFVNAMKPRKFTWNRRDGKWGGKKEIGFIAQELHEVEMDFSSTERTRLVSYENPSRLEAQPMNTYPILVKAIQELSAKVDSLQAEITKLKGA